MAVTLVCLVSGCPGPEQATDELSAELVEMSPEPGQTVELSEVNLAAKVEFSPATFETVELFVRRDGEVLEGSRQSVPVGSTFYDYELTDSDAPLGEHEYVLEAPGLLSSPSTLVIVTERKADLPDRIAFTRDDDLWIMNADGSEQTRLTSTGDCSSPAWSPDGDKLLYVRSSRWDQCHIWVYDIAAADAARLTKQASVYECPK